MHGCSKMTTQPTTEKKLTIQIRVEPGCLGPDGKAHIETFCAAAARIFAAVEPELVNWTCCPAMTNSCRNRSSSSTAAS